MDIQSTCHSNKSNDSEAADCGQSTYGDPR
jgi:hypothetical protein